MNKKKILIISVCVVALLTIVFLIARKGTETPQPVETASPLYITNIDDPAYSIDLDSRKFITQQIRFYLKRSDVDTTNVKAHIRDGSYVIKHVDENNGLIEFLVDIPSVKRTYKISLAISSEVDGDHSLIITCPAKDEVVYETFDCENDIKQGDQE